MLFIVIYNNNKTICIMHFKQTRPFQMCLTTSGVVMVYGMATNVQYLFIRDVKQVGLQCTYEGFCGSLHSNRNW